MSNFAVWIVLEGFHEHSEVRAVFLDRDGAERYMQACSAAGKGGSLYLEQHTVRDG